MYVVSAQPEDGDDAEAKKKVLDEQYKELEKRLGKKPLPGRDCFDCYGRACDEWNKRLGSCLDSGGIAALLSVIGTAAGVVPPSGGAGSIRALNSEYQKALRRPFDPTKPPRAEQYSRRAEKVVNREMHRADMAMARFALGLGSGMTSLAVGVSEYDSCVQNADDHLSKDRLLCDCTQEERDTMEKHTGCNYEPVGTMGFIGGVVGRLQSFGPKTKKPESKKRKK